MKDDKNELYIQNQKNHFIQLTFHHQTSKMQRFHKVKSMVKDIKKCSILHNYQNTVFFGDAACQGDGSPCTVDSESNFNIFPLLSIVQSSEKKSQEKKELDIFDDSKLAFLKDQNAEESKKKRCNPVSFRVTRKSRQHAFETISNVSSLLARPIGAKIRISQAKTTGCRNISLSHRPAVPDGDNEDSSFQFKRHTSIERKTKTKKERFSPKKVRKGLRTRRTLSPRKYSSPTRKFSISAWQTPEEFELTLF